MKSDELKLRIMLLNGEEVDSQLLASTSAAAAAADGCSDAEESDGSSDEEINEEDVERDRTGERDRINNRNKLLYADNAEEGEEEDIFEALKKRRQQYLAKTTPADETPSDEGQKRPVKATKVSKGRKRVESVTEEEEVEVDDGGDTESMRLRLDDLEEEEEGQQRNNRAIDEDVTNDLAEADDKEDGEEEGEKENVDGINVTSSGRRKRQKIIDSDSEEETTAMTSDPFDALLKGDATVEQQTKTVMDEGESDADDEVVGKKNKNLSRRVSKKRERSEEDEADSDQDDNSVGKAASDQKKVKRKRIVIADDDDED